MESTPKIRVLLVDDDVSVRLYIRMLITSMGAEVVGEGTNGREGVELFDTLKPDFVFLDINMPVMDGIAALKAIRERSQQVGIVMLTSHGSHEVVQFCLDAGANYHIRKDSPVDQLRREIGETLKWLEQVRSKGGSL